MNRLKPSFFSLLSVACAISVKAQIFSYSPAAAIPIPDGDATGLATVINVPSSDSALVGGVELSLNLRGSVQDGGFAGDLYVAIYHDGQATVLLNRPGRDISNPDGYDDTGDFHLTFRDSAAHDIHRYRDFATSTPTIGLTGVWQPDGRATSFKTVTTSDSRTAMLSQLNGTNERGQWLLFIADVTGGGVTDLSSWSIRFVSVPELERNSLLAGAMIGLWAFPRRARRAEGIGSKSSPYFIPLQTGEIPRKTCE